jgi:hypothetical protein
MEPHLHFHTHRGTSFALGTVTNQTQNDIETKESSRDVTGILAWPTNSGQPVSWQGFELDTYGATFTGLIHCSVPHFVVVI